MSIYCEVQLVYRVRVSRLQLLWNGDICDIISGVPIMGRNLRNLVSGRKAKLLPQILNNYLVSCKCRIKLFGIWCIKITGNSILTAQ